MKRFRTARRSNGDRKRILPDARTWLRLSLAVLTWGSICTILLGYNLFPGHVWLHLNESSPMEVRAPAPRSTWTRRKQRPCANRPPSR